MEVRRVETDEWRRMREIRLRALADAPDAFGTTYDDSVTQDDAFWRGMLRDPAWVADEQGSWVGMVRARPEGASAHLLSLWVDPTARKRGVGAALVGAVVGWARERGHASVRLWVADGNPAAWALYRSAGFTPTGDRQPLPSNPSIAEFEMRLDLGSDAASGAGDR